MGSSANSYFNKGNLKYEAGELETQAKFSQGKASGKVGVPV